MMRTDSAQTATARDDLVGASARRHPQPPRVFVVDDESMMRAFVRRSLRDEGYATTTAGDGIEALQVAAQFGTFDMAIVDLRMPQMNGVELARRLRQTNPRLKVLYLTGYRHQLLREKPILEEGESLLEKPCTVAELRRIVRTLLDNRVQP
jgi:two-component system cell cycle sensor histidine kinase/response regulator CckA